MGLFDLFFPKYCISCKKLGSFLCTDCFAKISLSSKTMCLVCGKSALDGLTHPNCLKKDSIDGCFIAYEYSGPIKQLLYVFKYQPYVSAIAPLLGELFYEASIQKEPFMHIIKHSVIITPIPLHKKKFRQRGYNHAKLLAEQLGKRVPLPVISLLERSKETHVQAGLSKIARTQNIKDAFELKKRVVVPTIVILLDDIVTTGATFLEAAKVLKKSGVKRVYGLAFSGEN